MTFVFQLLYCAGLLGNKITLTVGFGYMHCRNMFWKTETGYNFFLDFLHRLVCWDTFYACGFSMWVRIKFEAIGN